MQRLIGRQGRGSLAIFEATKKINEFIKELEDQNIQVEIKDVKVMFSEDGREAAVVAIVDYKRIQGVN